MEEENEKYEKNLDISKYKNLVNAVNSMNIFYEKEQKNKNILDEIKLTKEQINQLKLKEHVLQYIKENGEDIEYISQNENQINNVDENNLKKEENISDLFKGLNMNNNYEKYRTFER